MPFLMEKKPESRLYHSDSQMLSQNILIPETVVLHIEEESKSGVPKQDTQMIALQNERVRRHESHRGETKIIMKEEIKIDVEANDYLHTEEAENFENILRTKPIKKVDHRMRLSKENNKYAKKKYESLSDNVGLMSSEEIGNIFTIRDNLLDEGSYLNVKKDTSFVDDEEDKTNLLELISSPSKSKQSNIANFKRDIPITEVPPQINFKKKDIPSNSSTFIWNSSATTPNQQNKNISESIVLPHDTEKKDQLTFRRSSLENVVSENDEINRASRNVFDIYKRQLDEQVMTQSSYDLLERGDKAINKMKNQLITEDGNLVINSL
jgi:hypothetical protein